MRSAMELLGLYEAENSGVLLKQNVRDRVLDAKADALVSQRLAALSAKDFATADRIRAGLLAEGIQLKDSKNAAGERVTTWELKR